MTRLQEAYKYLNRIRNARKRQYGFDYLSWLKNGAVGESPDRGSLSYMGAQAVRMELHDILGDEPFVAVRGNPGRSLMPLIRSQYEPSSGLVNPFRTNAARRRRRAPARRRGGGGGGIGTGTLLVIGGALLLFTPLGSGLLSSFTGGGVPSGYTSVGQGLYRGPDGRLYARNPQTGAMVPAAGGTTPTSAEDLLLRAGIAVLPAITSGVSSWLRSLFSAAPASAAGATTVLPDLPPLTLSDIWSGWSGNVSTTPLDVLTTPIDTSAWWSGIDLSAPVLNPADFSLG